MTTRIEPAHLFSHPNPERHARGGFGSAEKLCAQASARRTAPARPTSRLSLLTLVATLLLTAPAHAYRTAAGLPKIPADAIVRWASGRIDLNIYDVSIPGVSPGRMQTLASEAAAVWMQPDCSQVSFSYVSATTQPAAPGDGMNTIQWITTGWKSRGVAADQSAVTDVVYETSADTEWPMIEGDLQAV